MSHVALYADNVVAVECVAFHFLELCVWYQNESDNTAWTGSVDGV